MIKTAVSLISSLAVGMMLKDILRAKGRLMSSAFFAASSFVFVLAAILVGAIAQFGITVGTALGFLVAGAFLALAARWLFPEPQISEVLGGLDGAQLAQLAEQFMRGFEAGMISPNPPGPESAPPPPVVAN